MRILLVTALTLTTQSVVLASSGGEEGARASEVPSTVLTASSDTFASEEHLLETYKACDQGSLNKALIDAASSGQHIVVEFLLKKSNGLGLCPDKVSVNKAFTTAVTTAVENRKLSVVQCLLKKPMTVKESPSKEAVNRALRSLSSPKIFDKDVLAFILGRDRPKSLWPDLVSVNQALKDAIDEYQNDPFIRYLVDPASPLSVRPDSECVNYILNYIIHTSVDHEEGDYKERSPDPKKIIQTQDMVNNALVRSVERGTEAFVAYLLDPESPLSVRPDLNSVNEALTTARAKRFEKIVGYLEAYERLRSGGGAAGGGGAS